MDLQHQSLEHQLRAIIAGTTAILEKSSFEEAARELFDQCCALTGAISGYVALLSEDGSENELLFLEDGGLDCSVSPELPMPVRGLRAEAYRTHKVVYDNDFMNSKWMQYMPEGHVVLKNVMFSPLIIDDRVVGIIGVANKAGDFTEEDAQIARIFGELAAVALVLRSHIDQLEQKNRDLEETLGHVRTLERLLPICSYCKNIRGEHGEWSRIDSYIARHTDARFTHSICPDCLKRWYPENFAEILDKTRC